MTLTELSTARYHGLNLTDLQILMHLANEGPLSMGDLAAKLDITDAGLTVAARKLVAKGVIRRIRDFSPDADRRVVIVDLSELGRVRLHQITGTFPEPAPTSSTSHSSLTKSTHETRIHHPPRPARPRRLRTLQPQPPPRVALCLALLPELRGHRVRHRVHPLHLPVMKTRDKSSGASRTMIALAQARHNNLPQRILEARQNQLHWIRQKSLASHPDAKRKAAALALAWGQTVDRLTQELNQKPDQA